MYLAYKFTDRDVREDPRLEQAAYDFLRQYLGEFEFLRHAKLDLSFATGLPVATVRGVLNCMRADTCGVRLLTLWTGTSRTVPTHRVPQRAVVVPMRPAYMVPRHTFKAMFVVSNHLQAYIAHLVDPDRSELRWWTVGQFMELVLITICGQKPRHGMLSLTDQGRLICRACQLG